MLRLILFFLALATLALGLAWFADRPGVLLINWQGWEIETSVFMAVVALALLVGLALLVWSLIRQIAAGPSAIGNLFRRRREKRGLEALSGGMIAVGSGDKVLAGRYAAQARKALPNEPLTALLRAQAAELAGDRGTTRRVFEAMLGSPDTELLGLRGLFLEAEREGEVDAARHLAERAVRRNPRLRWAVDALFDLQCRQGNWTGALGTLAIARKHAMVDKRTANRRRAVLLSGLGRGLEDTDMDKAMEIALDAHKLAPDLVPAAEIAGRLLAAKGNTSRAAKIVARTWKRAPHPDLALVYAFARPGDSPKDRLQRIQDLAAMTPHNIEAPIAVADAAIEARQWDIAREALEPLLEKRLTARVCVLMARIEDGQHCDRGRAREWLARAVNAKRDPAWMADGMVSDRWMPVSPVSGRLDAFEWKVPVVAPESVEQERILLRLMAFSGGMETLIGHGSEDIEAPLHGARDAGGTGVTPPVALPGGSFPGGGAGEIRTLPAVSGVSDVEAEAIEPEHHGDVEAEAEAEVTAAAVAAGNAGEDGPGDEQPQPFVSARHDDEGAPPAPADEVTEPEHVEVHAIALAAPVPRKEVAESSAGPAGEMGRKGREPAIFVPPRPPDDPGPGDDLGDVDAPASPLARYRLPPVKDSA